MAIIKWDPLHNSNAMQDRIDKLFDDSFPGCSHGDAASACAWTPVVDIYETDRGVVIAVDLPGVNKEDVVLEIKDNVLFISGERHADPISGATHYYRRERTCGAFQRSFSLHAVVDPEMVKARFKNGVLVVEIPNPEVDEPKQIQVETE